MGTVTITCRAAGLDAGRQLQHIRSRRNRDLRAQRRPGAAQTLGGQGGDRLRARRALRWPSRPHRQSRPHLPHSGRRQLRGHRAPRRAAGLERRPCAGLRRCLIGTGNTGKVFLLGAAQTHEYASDVLDAGALARFGRVEIEPGSAAIEILTRTGNIEQPVRGWTDWQPLNNGVVASPPLAAFCSGRPFCTRAAWWAASASIICPSTALPLWMRWWWFPARASIRRRITAASRRPSTSRFPPQARTRRSFDANPNNSPIQGVERPHGHHRPLGRARRRWRRADLLALHSRRWRKRLALLKDKITEKAYSFDATQIPDGGYQIKVVASDAPSHTARRRPHRRKDQRPLRSGHHAALVVNVKAARADPPSCARQTVPARPV